MSEAIEKAAQPQSIAVRVQDALFSRKPEDLASVASELDAHLAKLERLEKMVKDALRGKIREQGIVTTAAGSMELTTGDWVLTLKAMVGPGRLDDRKVEAKLRAKGMDPSMGMDATISYATNADKLATLKMASKWTDQDTKDCEVEQTWALQKPKRIRKEDEE